MDEKEDKAVPTLQQSAETAAFKCSRTHVHAFLVGGT